MTPQHPKYRVPDILIGYALAPEVWQELFDYILEVRQWIPFKCRLQLVGSRAFGCANYVRDDEGHKSGPGEKRITAASDIDINIACDDWNTQIPAIIWSKGFHEEDGKKVGNMAKVIDHMNKWMFKTGLNIDIAPRDCNSQMYNCYMDLEELVLHFRYDGTNEPMIINESFPLQIKPDSHPIDLRTFKIEAYDSVPVLEQMLRWDNFSFQYVSMDHPKRIGGYSKDDWVAEIPEWRQRYGKYFQEYVPDRTV
jgi:hypothetical protein